MAALLHITERCEEGEAYPHIYGPLPVTSVTEVIPVGRDEAGRLILPGS